MSMIRIIARSILRIGLLTLPISAFAQSQGTVPNHAVPIGKGPGVSGFGSTLPGVSGNCLTSNGASSDPSFQFCNSSDANIVKYGAVPNDSTKAAVNAAAFASAFAATNTAYCPEGESFYVPSINIPVNVVLISGCKLIAQGTYATNAGVLMSFNHNVNLNIQNTAITIDNSTYGAFMVRGIELGFPTNTTLQNVSITGGYNGIDIGAGTNIRLDGVRVTGTSNVGAYFNSSSTGIILDSSIFNNTGLHSFLAQNAGVVSVSNSQSINSSAGGFWCSICQDATITGSVTYNSRFEGFHFNDTVTGAIVGNSYKNAGNSVEIGISVSNDSGNISKRIIVSGNTIESPGSFGIDVGGVQNSYIGGNTIYNPGMLGTVGLGRCIQIDQPSSQFNTVENNHCTAPISQLTALSWSAGVATATTTSPHGLAVGDLFSITRSTPSGYNGGFVAIAGTTGSTINYALVSNPGVPTVLGYLGNMDYWVTENNDSGAPSNNVVGSNSGTTPITAYYLLNEIHAPKAPYTSVVGSTSGEITFLPQAAAGTYNWNWPTTAGTSGQFLTSAGGAGAPMTWNTIGGAWTSFTPTITCGTGTVTSVTPTGAWRAIGKTVFFRMRITIVTNGSCAATVIASLPINTIDVVTITGRENALTGKQVQGYGGPAVVNLSLYDNLYPGGTGADIYISGTYESI